MMTRSSPDDASCIVWAVGTFSFTFITFLSLTKCFITVFSYDDDDDDIQQQQKCTTTTWHPSHNHLHHSKHGPTTMTTTTMTCRGVFRYVFNVFSVFYLLFLFIDSTNLKMTCTSRRRQLCNTYHQPDENTYHQPRLCYIVLLVSFQCFFLFFTLFTNNLSFVFRFFHDQLGTPITNPTNDRGQRYVF